MMCEMCLAIFAERHRQATTALRHNHHYVIGDLFEGQFGRSLFILYHTVHGSQACRSSPARSSYGL